MFSDSPSTPGRSTHRARAQISICAPACEAAYSSSVSTGSTRLLSLSLIRAGSPGRGRGRDAAHLLDQRVAHRERRHQQPLERLRPAEPVT